MKKVKEAVAGKSAKEIIVAICYGATKALFGTGSVVLMVASIYGIVSVGDESGWIAILIFVLSSFGFFASVLCFLVFGSVANLGGEDGKKLVAASLRKGSHVRHGNAGRS